MIFFSDYGSISFYLFPSRSISLGLNADGFRVGKIYDVTPFFETSSPFYDVILMGSTKLRRMINFLGFFPNSVIR